MAPTQAPSAHVNDSDTGLEERIAEAGSLGLLFGAPWCPAWGLVRDRLAEAHDLGAPWQAVDVDEHPHLADRYLVVSLPTLILLQGGRETARLLGSFSIEQASSLLRRGGHDQSDDDKAAR